MRIWAYCCASFAPSARKAAGVDPVTCPPITVDDVLAHWDGPYDFVYIDLHGRPGDVQWYGDERIPALTADQVRGMDFEGAIVFAVNCYLGDDDSPMLDALLDAGASYVIGGAGENFGGARHLMGAPLLAMYFRRALRGSLDVLRALSLAKTVLRWGGLWPVPGGLGSQAVADALEFRAFVRKSNLKQEDYDGSEKAV